MLALPEGIFILDLLAFPIECLGDIAEDFWIWKLGGAIESIKVKESGTSSEDRKSMRWKDYRFTELVKLGNVFTFGGIHGDYLRQKAIQECVCLTKDENICSDLRDMKRPRQTVVRFHAIVTGLQRTIMYDIAFPGCCQLDWCSGSYYMALIGC